MYKLTGIALAAGVLLLAGCAAQQEGASEKGIPSVQEISLEAANTECQQRAIMMTSGNNDRPWFGTGWQQQSYYEWCMEDKGFTRDDYSQFNF